MKIEGRESIQIVSQAVETTAKDWWYIHENHVFEYDQFKTLFKERFWNSTMQRKTHRKVEFGTCYAGGKLDRVTYATTIFGYDTEFPHRLEDFSGIFRKIQREYATWNIPGIFTEYFKNISKIIHRDISANCLWNTQGIFHGIWRERINEYFKGIFHEIFQFLSRNLSDTSINRTFPKPSINIPMEDFRWVFQKVYNETFRVIFHIYSTNF